MRKLLITCLFFSSTHMALATASKEATPFQDTFTTEDFSFHVLKASEAEKGRLWLQDIFNQKNKNVAHYSDGTHSDPARIEAKINVWGLRADKGNLLRAYFVFAITDTKKESPLGIVNLGSTVNVIDYDKKTMLEGGFLFKDTVKIEEAGKAIKAVYVDYMNQLHEADLLAVEGLSNIVIYTMAYTNPLLAALAASGMTPLSAKDDAADKEIRDALLKVSSRFGRVDIEGNLVFTEGLTPKKIYFHEAKSKS